MPEYVISKGRLPARVDEAPHLEDPDFNKRTGWLRVAPLVDGHPITDRTNYPETFGRIGLAVTERTSKDPTKAVESITGSEAPIDFVGVVYMDGGALPANGEIFLSGNRFGIVTIEVPEQ